MYFQQIQEIVNKILGIEPSKDQTRRACKDGESYLFLAADGRQYKWTSANGSRHATELETILDVYTPSGRLKWQVGRDYAVSPGRGKPGVWWNATLNEWRLPNVPIKPAAPYCFIVNSQWGLDNGWQPLRIKLLQIRREPLQAISEADAVAEGCEPEPCPQCGGSGIVVTHEADPNGDGTIPMQWGCGCYGGAAYPPTALYRALWKEINGPKSWDANPDVWALTFEVVR